MAKSKSLNNRAKKFVRSSSKNVQKALPVINKNIKNAGVMAKDVAKETLPIVEKGVSAVYGSLATGFNLGVKGAKNVSNKIKSVSRNKRSYKKHSRKTHRKH
jgi:hypothetical protein